MNDFAHSVGVELPTNKYTLEREECENIKSTTRQSHSHYVHWCVSTIHSNIAYMGMHAKSVSGSGGRLIELYQRTHTREPSTTPHEAKRMRRR